MLIRDAEVFGAGRMDVRIHGGVITECATGLVRPPGEDEIYAGGGWLLPGLHDHHIHLRSLAATYESVPLGPPHVRTATELAARLQEADRKLLPGKWIRGTGYREGEKVLQRNAGVKDIRGPWPAQIASGRRQ